MSNHLKIIILTLLFTVCLANADEPEQGLGFAGGLISGSGFSYRFVENGDIGYQITGIYFKNNSFHAFSVGAQMIHNLRKGENSSFYLLGGAGFYYNEYEEESPEFEPTLYTNVIEKVLSFGGGIGVSLNLPYNLLFTLEVPMVLNKDGIMPSFQSGIFYRL